MFQLGERVVSEEAVLLRATPPERGEDGTGHEEQRRTREEGKEGEQE